MSSLTSTPFGLVAVGGRSDSPSENVTIVEVSRDTRTWRESTGWQPYRSSSVAGVMRTPVGLTVVAIEPAPTGPVSAWRTCLLHTEDGSTWTTAPTPACLVPYSGIGAVGSTAAGIAVATSSDPPVLAISRSGGATWSCTPLYMATLFQPKVRASGSVTINGIADIDGNLTLFGGRAAPPGAKPNGNGAVWTATETSTGLDRATATFHSRLGYTIRVPNRWRQVDDVDASQCARRPEQLGPVPRTRAQSPPGPDLVHRSRRTRPVAEPRPGRAAAGPSIPQRVRHGSDGHRDHARRAARTANRTLPRRIDARVRHLPRRVRRRIIPLHRDHRRRRPRRGHRSHTADGVPREGADPPPPTPTWTWARPAQRRRPLLAAFSFSVPLAMLAACSSDEPAVATETSSTVMADLTTTTISTTTGPPATTSEPPTTTTATVVPPTTTSVTGCAATHMPIPCPLHDGQSVNLEPTGLPPLTTITVGLCVAAADPSVQDCTPGTTYVDNRSAVVDPAGAARLSLVAERHLLLRDRTVDCAVNACELRTLIQDRQSGETLTTYRDPCAVLRSRGAHPRFR